MSLSPGARKSALFAALGVTVLAAFFVGKDDQTAEPIERSAKRATAPRKSPVQEPPVMLSSEHLKRETVDWTGVNIFAARSWYVPPPPPPPAKPPPPSAPPLQFVYLGKIEEASGTKVFLARQGVNYSLQQGDQIDGTYRVEQISPQAVVLTYLPLNIRQTLPIGAMN